MALADDLLEQAHHLAKREPKRPRQASLRRAVSTAYYSLFHLLISSAILQWKGVHQRSQMARGFERGPMKSTFSKIGMPPTTAILRNGRAQKLSPMSILPPLLLPTGKLSSMRSLQRTTWSHCSLRSGRISAVWPAAGSTGSVRGSVASRALFHLRRPSDTVDPRMPRQHAHNFGYAAVMRRGPPL
jgi:hypothetical protein